LKNQTYLDGVTFSGGDPMDQSNAFAELAYKIKTKLNMNIWCYTGYTWEELLIKSHKDISIKNLLKNIDVLIDGPFINKLKSAQSKYRGSTNQRLIDVSQSLKLGRLILYVLK
jgi:anaerobic ribonucleoside-triphosphate reductase activating protein